MEVELKQYDGQTVTAQDDAILNDQLYGLNGIISGCNMNFISVNMVNIEEGYGLIKGREFKIKESTINCMLPDADGVGIIKLRMDLMNSSRPAEIITEAVSGDVYPGLEQDEDCNFTNGIYEIELARYTATAVAITELTQTYDVLEKKSVDKIKTEIGEMQQDISDLNNSLTASDSLKFQFATDGEGNYGFLGADGSLIPFKSGEELSIAVSTSATLAGVGNDKLHQAWFTTTIAAEKSDGTVILSESITGDSGRIGEYSSKNFSNRGTYNITV